MCKSTKSTAGRIALRGTSSTLMSRSKVVPAITGAISCPKCGIKESGKLSCCGRGGTWFRKCGDPGDSSFEHTWDEGSHVCDIVKSVSLFGHAQGLLDHDTNMEKQQLIWGKALYSNQNSNYSDVNSQSGADTTGSASAIGFISILIFVNDFLWYDLMIFSL